jgi:hypothetical protein
MNGSAKITPTFINVGPGRCATSWLHEILQAHPEVATANVKETEYFNSNFHQGHEWYLKHFEAANDPSKLASGEISNCYYTEPAVAHRIKEFNPQMRIIFNLRDPYTLMQSFHGFGVRRGIELGPLEESLDVHIGRLMGSGYSFRQRRKTLNPGDQVSLLNSVMLSRHIRSFLEVFPREQIYFFVYERLRSEQDTVLREIYDFIQVDSSFVPPASEQVVNAAITPKSKSVAKLATNVSYLLRRAGAYGLLSRLHQSRLIKRIFYSSNAGKTAAKVNPREVLDKETCFLLDEEMKNMIKVHQPLKQWWTPKSHDAPLTVEA